ncbi:MAG: glycosyltransferase family 1 protein [Kiritimatiellia bacterium]
MHIGLYLEQVHDNRLGGVGTYARRLAEIMASLHPAIRMTLLAGTAADGRWAADFAAARPAARVGVRRIRRNWKLDALLTRAAYLGFREHREDGLWPAFCRACNYVEWQCAGLGLDLVYSPNQSLPLPLWRRPAVFTLHDVQEIRLPENYTAGERASRAVYNALLLRGTRGVVVGYEHVRQDIMKFFHLPPDRVHLVPVPVEPPAGGTPPPPVTPRNVTGPFFLYPAQTWPHKNHETLLRAFAALSASTPAPHLVLTGRQTAHAAALQELAASLGVAGRVHWLGMVPEEQLAGLYAGCRAVVLPTRYEAGSFPLYEALRHGAPAICSSATSLPGVMGNPDFVFDPGDRPRLQNLLQRLLDDEAFLADNRAHVRKRAALLDTWARDCAQGLLALAETFKGTA